MNTLNNFFDQIHPLVVFVYGQIFFVMGMAIFMQSRQHSRLRLARDVRWLAMFGILHGIAEWGNFFIPTQSAYLPPQVIDLLLALRILMLAASFVCLLVFGAVMLDKRWPWILKAILAVAIAWFVIVLIAIWSTRQSDVWYPLASILAGYLLGLPGSVLAAYGIRYQAEIYLAPILNRGNVYRVLRIAGYTLVAYAILGGVIVPRSGFFPANIFNQDTVQSLLGIPIEVFRSIIGLALALSVIRALEIFDIEIDQLIESMEVDRIQADIRERIGQEIHDGAIQAVYAAILMLDSVLPRAKGDRELSNGIDSAKQVMDSAINDLRRSMVSLRATPPSSSLKVSLQKLIDDPRYSSLLQIKSRIEVEPNLKPVQIGHILAIVQECLSNIVRHASAHQAAISLQYATGGLLLCVVDDGRGFDQIATPERFGFRAMRDRARLLGGQLKIESQSGKGTTVSLSIPEGASNA